MRKSSGHSSSMPTDFTHDPHNLVAYLIPFPKPVHANIVNERVPPRFLIYTPPPPPLDAPHNGQEEGRAHKVQRKWQAEIRDAKTSDTKLTSWKGIKGRAIKGINWGMGQTKTTNLEFLNRFGDGAGDKDGSDGEKLQRADDIGCRTNRRTKGIEEVLLVTPPSVLGSPEELRAEFVNTMLRSKSKAQRDAVIATGLLPVSFAIDMLVVLVWPFGGLLEIDAVWLFASLKGAKTSRSITKRLETGYGQTNDDMLKLNFANSEKLVIL